MGTTKEEAAKEAFERLEAAIGWSGLGVEGSRAVVGVSDPTWRKVRRGDRVSRHVSARTLMAFGVRANDGYDDGGVFQATFGGLPLTEAVQATGRTAAEARQVACVGSNVWEAASHGRPIEVGYARAILEVAPDAVLTCGPFGLSSVRRIVEGMSSVHKARVELQAAGLDERSWALPLVERRLMPPELSWLTEIVIARGHAWVLERLPFWD